jgi:ribose 1,5-bisphosphokinase
MENGRFIYVVGASGAGKDTLLSFARAQLAEQPIAFAHRYITRPIVGSGEIHIPLTWAEFALRLDRDLFALHWDSHGLRYGIGREIDLWLARGMTVVVNGSRAALPLALSLYPESSVVMITASPETLRRRLEARGRETRPDIEERLAGAKAYPQDIPNMTCIDNDGPVEQGGMRLAAFFQKLVKDKGR